MVFGALLCACAPKLTKEQTAVVKAIEEEQGKTVKSIEFTSFELKGTQTIGRQMDKMTAALGLMKIPARLSAQNKEKMAAMRNSVDSLATSLEDRRDEVLFLVYAFDCSGKFDDGGEFSYENTFVNVLKDNSQAFYLTKGRASGKSMLFAVPGYNELMDKYRK